MFIVTLKPACKLCYEKSPSSCQVEKSHVWSLSFPYIHCTCPAWWHAGFAQPSSAQAALICWRWIRLWGQMRSLHGTDCPRQVAESPVCTPEAETAIMRGMEKHPTIWFRRGRISCAAQAKKEEVLRATSNLLHPSELQPLQQKVNRNREKKKKNPFTILLNVFIVLRFLWFPLHAPGMHYESTELLPSGARVPDRPAHQTGSPSGCHHGAALGQTSGQAPNPGPRWGTLGRLVELGLRGGLDLSYLEFSLALY